MSDEEYPRERGPTWKWGRRRPVIFLFLFSLVIAVVVSVVLVVTLTHRKRDNENVVTVPTKLVFSIHLFDNSILTPPNLWIHAENPDLCFTCEDMANSTILTIQQLDQSANQLITIFTYGQDGGSNDWSSFSRPMTQNDAVQWMANFTCNNQNNTKVNEMIAMQALFQQSGLTNKDSLIHFAPCPFLKIDMGTDEVQQMIAELRDINATLKLVIQKTGSDKSTYLNGTDAKVIQGDNPTNISNEILDNLKKPTTTVLPPTTPTSTTEEGGSESTTTTTPTTSTTTTTVTTTVSSSSITTTTSSSSTTTTSSSTTTTTTTPSMTTSFVTEVIPSGSTSETSITSTRATSIIPSSAVTTTVGVTTSAQTTLSTTLTSESTTSTTTASSTISTTGPTTASQSTISTTTGPTTISTTGPTTVSIESTTSTTAISTTGPTTVTSESTMSPTTVTTVTQTSSTTNPTTTTSTSTVVTTSPGSPCLVLFYLDASNSGGANLPIQAETSNDIIFYLSDNGYQNFLFAAAGYGTEPDVPLSPNFVGQSDLDNQFSQVINRPGRADKFIDSAINQMNPNLNVTIVTVLYSNSPQSTINSASGTNNWQARTLGIGITDQDLSPVTATSFLESDPAAAKATALLSLCSGGTIATTTTSQPTTSVLTTGPTTGTIGTTTGSSSASTQTTITSPTTSGQTSTVISSSMSTSSASSVTSTTASTTSEQTTATSGSSIGTSTASTETTTTTPTTTGPSTTSGTTITTASSASQSTLTTISQTTAPSASTSAAVTESTMTPTTPQSTTSTTATSVITNSVTTETPSPTITSTQSSGSTVSEVTVSTTGSSTTSTTTSVTTTAPSEPCNVFFYIDDSIYGVVNIADGYDQQRRNTEQIAFNIEDSGFYALFAAAGYGQKIAIPLNLTFVPASGLGQQFENINQGDASDATVANAVANIQLYLDGSTAVIVLYSNSPQSAFNDLFGANPKRSSTFGVSFSGQDMSNVAVVFRDINYGDDLLAQEIISLCQNIVPTNPTGPTTTSGGSTMSTASATTVTGGSTESTITTVNATTMTTSTIIPNTGSTETTTTSTTISPTTVAVGETTTNTETSPSSASIITNVGSTASSTISTGTTISSSSTTTVTTTPTTSIPTTSAGPSCAFFFYLDGSIRGNEDGGLALQFSNANEILFANEFFDQQGLLFAADSYGTTQNDPLTLNFVDRNTLLNEFRDIISRNSSDMTIQSAIEKMNAAGLNKTIITVLYTNSLEDDINSADPNNIRDVTIGIALKNQSMNTVASYEYNMNSIDLIASTMVTLCNGGTPTMPSTSVTTTQSPITGTSSSSSTSTISTVSESPTGSSISTSAATTLSTTMSSSETTTSTATTSTTVTTQTTTTASTISIGSTESFASSLAASTSTQFSESTITSNEPRTSTSGQSVTSTASGPTLSSTSTATTTAMNASTISEGSTVMQSSTLGDSTISMSTESFASSFAYSTSTQPTESTITSNQLGSSTSGQSVTSTAFTESTQPPASTVTATTMNPSSTSGGSTFTQPSTLSESTITMSTEGQASTISNQESSPGSTPTIITVQSTSSSPEPSPGSTPSVPPQSTVSSGPTSTIETVSTISQSSTTTVTVPTTSGLPSCRALFVADTTDAAGSANIEKGVISAAATELFANTQLTFSAAAWSYSSPENNKPIPESFINDLQIFAQSLSNLPQGGGTLNVTDAVISLNGWVVTDAVIVLFTASSQSDVDLAGGIYARRLSTVGVPINASNLTPVAVVSATNLHDTDGIVANVLALCQGITTVTMPATSTSLSSAETTSSATSMKSESTINTIRTIPTTVINPTSTPNEPGTSTAYSGSTQPPASTVTATTMNPSSTSGGSTFTQPSTLSESTITMSTEGQASTTSNQESSPGPTPTMITVQSTSSSPEPSPGSTPSVPTQSTVSSGPTSTIETVSTIAQSSTTTVTVPTTSGLPSCRALFVADISTAVASSTVEKGVIITAADALFTNSDYAFSAALWSYSSPENNQPIPEDFVSDSKSFGDSVSALPQDGGDLNVTYATASLNTWSNTNAVIVLFTASSQDDINAAGMVYLRQLSTVGVPIYGPNVDLTPIATTATTTLQDPDGIVLKVLGLCQGISQTTTRIPTSSNSPGSTGPTSSTVSMNSQSTMLYTTTINQASTSNQPGSSTPGASVTSTTLTGSTQPSASTNSGSTFTQPSTLSESTITMSTEGQASTTSNQEPSSGSTPTTITVQSTSSSPEPSPGSTPSVPPQSTVSSGPTSTIETVSTISQSSTTTVTVPTTSGLPSCRALFVADISTAVASSTVEKGVIITAADALFTNSDYAFSAALWSYSSPENNQPIPEDFVSDSKSFGDSVSALPQDGGDLNVTYATASLNTWSNTDAVIVLFTASSQDDINAAGMVYLRQLSTVGVPIYGPNVDLTPIATTATTTLQDPDGIALKVLGLCQGISQTTTRGSTTEVTGSTPSTISQSEGPSTTVGATTEFTGSTPSAVTESEGPSTISGSTTLFTGSTQSTITETEGSPTTIGSTTQFTGSTPSVMTESAGPSTTPGPTVPTSSFTGSTITFPSESTTTNLPYTGSTSTEYPQSTQSTTEFTGSSESTTTASTTPTPLICPAFFYIDGSYSVDQSQIDSQIAIISKAAEKLFEPSQIFSFRASMGVYGQLLNGDPDPSALIGNYDLFQQYLDNLDFSYNTSDTILDAISEMNEEPPFANVLTLLFTNSDNSTIDPIPLGYNKYQMNTYGLTFGGQDLSNLTMDFLPMGQNPDPNFIAGLLEVEIIDFCKTMQTTSTSSVITASGSPSSAQSDTQSTWFTQTQSTMSTGTGPSSASSNPVSTSEWTQPSTGASLSPQSTISISQGLTQSTSTGTEASPNTMGSQSTGSSFSSQSLLTTSPGSSQSTVSSQSGSSSGSSVSPRSTESTSAWTEASGSSSSSNTMESQSASSNLSPQSSSMTSPGSTQSTISSQSGSTSPSGSSGSSASSSDWTATSQSSFSTQSVSSPSSPSTGSSDSSIGSSPTSSTINGSSGSTMTSEGTSPISTASSSNGVSTLSSDVSPSSTVTGSTSSSDDQSSPSSPMISNPKTITCNAFFYLDTSNPAQESKTLEKMLVINVVNALFERNDLTFTANSYLYGDDEVKDGDPDPATRWDNFDSFQEFLNGLYDTTPNDDDVEIALEKMNEDQDFEQVITVLFTASNQETIDGGSLNNYKDKTIGVTLIPGVSMLRIANLSLSRADPDIEESLITNIVQLCNSNFN